jgi:hypothetical protein
MKCKKCGTDNAPLKKCCESCGKILDGSCINNVTGRAGYRNADGSFAPNEDEKEAK